MYSWRNKNKQQIVCVCVCVLFQTAVTCPKLFWFIQLVSSLPLPSLPCFHTKEKGPKTLVFFISSCQSCSLLSYISSFNHCHWLLARTHTCTHALTHTHTHTNTHTHTQGFIPVQDFFILQLMRFIVQVWGAVWAAASGAERSHDNLHAGPGGAVCARQHQKWTRLRQAAQVYW